MTPVTRLVTGISSLEITVTPNRRGAESNCEARPHDSARFDQPCSLYPRDSASTPGLHCPAEASARPGGGVSAGSRRRSGTAPASVACCSPCPQQATLRCRCGGGIGDDAIRRRFDTRTTRGSRRRSGTAPAAAAGIARRESVNRCFGLHVSSESIGHRTPGLPGERSESEASRPARPPRAAPLRSCHTSTA